MTLHISEDFAACLINWSVSVILNAMPPRDPNDDHDEEEDEEDEDQDNEPAVVREPDDNE